MLKVEMKSKKIAKTKLSTLKNRFSKRMVRQGNTVMCVGENLIEKKYVSKNYVSENVEWHHYLKKATKKR